ncbi:MAG: hypothetical protein GC155_13495 [Alphaproteobacteria bacterium]|nr:hypothetical protein [Alphaproteobacteria bacterium]
MRCNALLYVIVAMMLFGCTSTASRTEQRVSTGQLLAQSQCPLRIIKSRAWVDFLPGPARTANQLHVEARFSTNDATAMVFRSDATTSDTLVLDLRISETSSTPGGVTYAEPATTAYKRVVFRCRGGDILVIPEIRRAR